jgi:diguanylate cyclase (GGDEF)-like protein
MEASEPFEQTASDGEQTVAEADRDESAAARPPSADDRHATAGRRETPAQRDRARAAADRALAAADRADAAADRMEAARDRGEALRARSDAEIILKGASTDVLTGARTRQFGLEEIARELRRAQRTGATLVLAFVDVDGLKRVNDSQGHPAGDALLRRTGEALLAGVRVYDLVVRYGGDEFVCAMPNLTAHGARPRFELIASGLAAIDSEHSITFGLAEARLADSIAELIARADADLLARRIDRRR